jgi:hypothetical protein
VKKYGRAGHATDDNILYNGADALCMGTCNVCCFYTATILTRTSHIVTLQVHCLPCYAFTVTSIRGAPNTQKDGHLINYPSDISSCVLLRFKQTVLSAVPYCTEFCSDFSTTTATYIDSLLYFLKIYLIQYP